MSRETPHKGQEDPPFWDKMLLGVAGLERVKKQVRGDKIVRHTLNTFVEGFAWGRHARLSRIRYAQKIFTIKISPTSSDLGEMNAPEYEISFSKKDIAGIHPHDNYHMVITVRCDDWDISSVYGSRKLRKHPLLGLLWKAFPRLGWSQRFPRITGGTLRRASAWEMLHYTEDHIWRKSE